MHVFFWPKRRSPWRLIVIIIFFIFLMLSTSDGRILLYFSVYIGYNHDYDNNLIFFTPCQSLISSIGVLPFNRLFFETNHFDEPKPFSRPLATFACRFFLISSPLPCFSHFTFQIVRSADTFSSPSWRVSPMKKEEDPWCEPSTSSTN